MKRFAMVLSLGAMFALSAMAESWTGTISDSMCGAKHAAGEEKDAKCVEGCVKQHGAEPVLVVGDKVYKLSADSKEKVAAHLGHKVTVDGKLDGETISVDSVKM